MLDHLHGGERVATSLEEAGMIRLGFRAENVIPSPPNRLGEDGLGCEYVRGRDGH
jgi:hypothetical protein